MLARLGRRDINAENCGILHPPQTDDRSIEVRHGDTMRVPEPSGNRIAARVMFAVASALFKICVTPPRRPAERATATGAIKSPSGVVPDCSKARPHSFRSSDRPRRESRGRELIHKR